jgi:hypothetical protein
VPARVVALVDDLMDRSRISASLPGTVFVADAEGCADADVVLIDLARHADRVAVIRARVPSVRIIGFGPHIDDARLEGARRDGADLVLPRSRFFHDPKAALSTEI